MERELLLEIPGRPERCRIFVGPLEEVPWEGRRCLIADRRVVHLHGTRLPPGPRLEVRGGEALKTLRGLRRAWDFLATVGADRETLLVGVGGGTVTDLAGFAAATWHRGIPFAAVATTLLAQVDAALGGKSGINLLGAKNQVGMNRQPGLVVCDPSMLATLKRRDYLAGLAEVVKTALLDGPDLFRWVEEHREALVQRDPPVLEEAVFRCLAFKVSVVREDPEEHHRRQVLNLGHTLGHAWEVILGLTHGEAVSAGLVAACHLSVLQGRLCPSWRDRTEALLAFFGLPTRVEAPVEKVRPLIERDKKGRGGTARWVLLEGPGRPVLVEIPISDALGLLHRC